MHEKRVNFIVKTNDQKELLRLLEIFFNECPLNKRNTVNQNKVAIYLKQKLSQLGRWRNLPRGGHSFRPKSSSEIIRVCLTNARQPENKLKYPSEPPF